MHKCVYITNAAIEVLTILGFLKFRGPEQLISALNIEVALQFSTFKEFTKHTFYCYLESANCLL